VDVLVLVLVGVFVAVAVEVGEEVGVWLGVGVGLPSAGYQKPPFRAKAPALVIFPASG